MVLRHSVRKTVSQVQSSGMSTTLAVPGERIKRYLRFIGRDRDGADTSRPKEVTNVLVGFRQACAAF